MTVYMGRIANQREVHVLKSPQFKNYKSESVNTTFIRIGAPSRIEAPTSSCSGPCKYKMS